MPLQFPPQSTTWSQSNYIWCLSWYRYTDRPWSKSYRTKICSNWTSITTTGSDSSVTGTPETWFSETSVFKKCHLSGLKKQVPTRNIEVFVALLRLWSGSDTSWGQTRPNLRWRQKQVSPNNDHCSRSHWSREEPRNWGRTEGCPPHRASKERRVPPSSRNPGHNPTDPRQHKQREGLWRCSRALLSDTTVVQLSDLSSGILMFLLSELVFQGKFFLSSLFANLWRYFSGADLSHIRDDTESISIMEVAKVLSNWEKCDQFWLVPEWQERNALRVIAIFQSMVGSLEGVLV